MEDTSQEELRQLVGLLERSGLKPLLCDTPVRVVESAVRAGQPTTLGDMSTSDYFLLPKQLVGMSPELLISVQGDSMKDSDIEEDDLLKIQLGTSVRDGDIVVVSIDGECTVKTYFTDEDGQQWLVPRNENYDAILLTEEMNVQLVGRVVAIMKPAPRTGFRDCQRVVRRTRSKLRACQGVSPQQVEQAIRAVAPHVEHGRQWYAVFRALQDCQAVEPGAYAEFVELVRRLVPTHGHLPVASEVRRMAVQSFSKPVALWERGYAPVSGVRYDDYLRIARLTGEKLRP